MEYKPKLGSFLALYGISFLSGGLGVPIFLIWALFFDGSWIGFFISLLVLFVAMFILDRIHKSIIPPIPRLSLLMIDFPSGLIGWMWFITLGNTIFHFGKALFFEGSWWVWLGTLFLSGFMKAVTRQANAQNATEREIFLTDLGKDYSD